MRHKVHAIFYNIEPWRVMCKNILTLKNAIDYVVYRERRVIYVETSNVLTNAIGGNVSWSNPPRCITKTSGRWLRNYSAS